MRFFQRIIFIVSFFLVTFFAFAVISSVTAFITLRNMQFRSARTTAQVGLFFLQPFSLVTLHAVPDLEFWKTSLEITAEVDPLIQSLHHSVVSALQKEKPSQSSSDVQNQIHEFLTLIMKENDTLQHTFLFKKILPSKYQDLLSHIVAAVPDIEIVTQTLFETHHTFLILFQNSEELRATGGFIGSYGLVEIDHGALHRLIIQDIYEPDGHFHGFVDAPHGLFEYLSDGKGMRLPDANWSPDLPTSAHSILSFFTAANEPSIDGMITLNVHTAEEIVKILGPIELPDFHTTVTAENLSTVARSDRSTFFPGSQQKKDFLSALFTAIKLHLTDMSTQQQKAIAHLLVTEIKTKNIQFFDTSNDLEALYKKYDSAGTVHVPAQNELFFYPVESNVGINKANARVQRDIQLDIHEKNTTLTIHFSNQNLTHGPYTEFIRPNHYVNYQRVFVRPDMSVQSITVSGKSLEKWDENILRTDSGAVVKQIGFLVVVPEQEENTAVITFTNPFPVTRATPVFFQKQSGLPPLRYILQKMGTAENTSTLLL